MFTGVITMWPSLLLLPVVAWLHSSSIVSGELGSKDIGESAPDHLCCAESSSRSDSCKVGDGERPQVVLGDVFSSLSAIGQ